MFDLLEWVKGVIFVMLLIVVAIFCLIGLTAGLNYVGYWLNKTNCVVKVHGDTVYQGNSHFISLGGVGENGNTKVLKIYKDKAGFVLLKKYVDDDITVTESEE